MWVIEDNEEISPIIIFLIVLFLIIIAFAPAIIYLISSGLLSY